MKLLNRALIVTFIFLLIFVIGEIIFASISSPKTMTTLSSVQNTTPSPIVSQNNAISEGALYRYNSLLRYFKNDVLTSSSVSTTAHGTISFISMTPKTLERNKQEISVSLQLTLQGPKGSVPYLFTADELKLVKVTSSTVNGETQLTINDLKVGDVVTVTMVLDLLHNKLASTQIVKE